MECICVTCGNVFRAKPKDIRRGAKYCSTTCYHTARAIGVRCVSCNSRDADTPTDYQVCRHCQSLQVACPVCTKAMPRYRQRGRLRRTCSDRCAGVHAARARTTTTQRRGALKRYANHVRITPANTLIRRSSDYRTWRTAVFIRDNYTCQDCGQHGGTLQAHHIASFATTPARRCDVTNGITVCVPCHRQRHLSPPLPLELASPDRR